MDWFARMFGRPSQTENRGGYELPVSFDTDAIEGYRIWRIRDENGVALKSLIQNYTWEIHNTAECASQHAPAHWGTPAPGAGCVCGFYAQLPDQPFDEWITHVRGRVHASGQIALTGRVIVCTRGYKAQHAEILSPVFVDVECTHTDCVAPVTRIRLPGNSPDFWGHCDEHDPYRDDAVLVDAKPWIRDTLESLSARYPSIEFLTFQEV